MKNLLYYLFIFILSFVVLFPVSLLAAENNSILVLRASGDKLAQTYMGIKDDLGEDYNLIEKVIDPQNDEESSFELIKTYLQDNKPSLIVLIGNISARLYTRYQKLNAKVSFPPSLIASALFVDRLMLQISNSRGIRHEIPAVTSISNLRTIVKQPVKRVGVIYRQWMKNYIQINKNYCLKEGIELVAIEISDRITIKNLSYHLRHLVQKNIDALWVVNDNALINPQLVQNVWLPNIRQFNKPVIVGLESLTSTPLNFGTFSVVPDQYTLGVQTAGMIAEIIDEGILSFDRKTVYEPVSVKKLLNIKLMNRRGIKTNELELENIDRLIK